MPEVGEVPPDEFLLALGTSGHRRYHVHGKGIGSDPLATRQAHFNVGQLVRHRLFDYRGVVIDVDPEFMGSDQWYRDNALTRPPKDRPWYHVLVDGGSHQTYVAERNLVPDESGEPVRHPHLGDYFSGFSGHGYLPRQRAN
ncbi:MAG: heat shock protein HspQ [Gammaproteobacteria bacterium]|nr:MAG: heat shock protein HspQ [Gammaproteobacteria bacterium]